MKGGKYKKGSAFADLILAVVIIVSIALVTIISWNLFGKIKTNLEEKNMIGEEGKEMLEKNYNKFVSLFDKLFLVAVVVVYLSVLFFSFIVDVHPVFFFFSIILLALIIFIGAILVNTWSNIAENIEGTTDFVIMPFFFNHFFYFIIPMSFLVLIVLFSKTSNSWGGF